MLILIVGFSLGLLILLVMGVFGPAAGGTKVADAGPRTGSHTSISWVRFLLAFTWITRAIPRTGRVLVALIVVTLGVAIRITFSLCRLGTIYAVRIIRASPLCGVTTTLSRRSAPMAIPSMNRTRAIGLLGGGGAGPVSGREAANGHALTLIEIT